MEESAASSSSDINLPGFRFHPTEEELVNFYLKSIVFGNKLRGDIIGFLNIYNYDPRELPGLAKIGEREWYFFVPRNRKHGSGGGRPNRTTENGFWKATGSDRKIVSMSEPKKLLGLKKTLVFYEGRAPRGRKTDWVMNEYRLPHTACCPNDKSKDIEGSEDIVLCKIYMKATSLKVLEQRAAMGGEEINKLQQAYTTSATPSMDIPISFCHQIHENLNMTTTSNLPNGRVQNLAELQLPKLSMHDNNWDALWTLENLTPYFLTPMCSFT